MIPSVMPENSNFYSDSMMEALGISTKADEDPRAPAFQGINIFSAWDSFFSNYDASSIPVKLSVYRDYMKAYTGEHFYKSEEDEVVYNMCRSHAHQSNDWLFGKSWKVKAIPGNEVLAKLVDEVWEANQRDIICYLMGHNASITGDGYLHVTVDSSNTAKTFDPSDISINWVQAPYVHPIFDPFDSTKMMSCLLQYPVNAMKVGTDLVLYSPSLLDHGDPVKAVYSLYYTKDRVVEYLDDRVISDKDNTFNEVPVYHCQNILNSRHWMGESDLADVWEVNRHMDRTMNKIQEIVNYNADPTTVVIGANPENLVRASNKVWAIQNPNAKVMNLEAGSKMGGAGEHIDRLMNMYSHVGSSPKAVRGDINSLSNIKAAAIEMLYLPKVQITRRKQISYGVAINKVSSLIARLLVANKTSLKRLVSNKEQIDRFGIKWGDPLPRDEREILDNIISKLKNGLMSQAEALRKLGTEDLETAALEISADKRESILNKKAESVASKGGEPNTLSVHTGSVSMILPDEAVEEDLKIALQAARKLSNKTDVTENETAVE